MIPQHKNCDILIIEGNIRTMNASLSQASFMAIKDGIIIDINSDDGWKKYTKSAKRVIQLRGKTIIPGWIECHAHLLGVGEAQSILDLRSAKSEVDAADLVEMAKKKFLSKSARNQDHDHKHHRCHLDSSRPIKRWLVGRGWDQNRWPGQAMPTQHSISKNSADDLPVYLTRIDGHAAWVNKAALLESSITKETRDPVGGLIIRDGSGVPTGVLIDTAMDLVYQKIQHEMNKDRETKRNILREMISSAISECLRLGITSFHDAGTDQESFDVLQDLARQEKLPLRIYSMIDARDRDFLEEALELGPLQHPFLSRRSVKYFADGALGSRGAWMKHPYAALKERGLLLLREDEFQRDLKRLAEKRFQVATHAIGDAANDWILTAYEKTLKNAPKDLRFRVEHAQIVDPSDIKRFKALDIIASMQSIHCTSDMPWITDFLGQERVAKGGLYAWQDFLRAGVTLVNGSDAPVESLNPLDGFYAGVTRQNDKSWPSDPKDAGWHHDQRMTREQALRSYTSSAAKASFEERVKGSLEVGKWADFVLLSQDIMTIPPQELLKTKVVMTIVGGSVVFDSELDS